MSVGYPASKNDIDSRAGGLAIDVRNKLYEVQQFKLFLDAMTNQALLDLGYTQNDVNNLKAAFVDLDKLARIYLGAEVQATPYDFRTFAKFLTGVA